MKKLTTILTILAVVSTFIMNAQVAINDDGSDADGSAKLDISSTEGGILIPRMTQAQRNAISNPANGLLIYQTTSSSGFYYYNGSSWLPLSSEGDDWGLTGNAAASSDFIGTTNSIDFITRTNDTERMRVLSSGEVVVNNTSPFLGDVFSSYAAGNNYAINGYSVNSPAIYGESSGTGHALYGIVDNTSTNAVRGINFENAAALTTVVSISGTAGSISGTATTISLRDQQTGVIGTGNGTGGIGIAGFLWDGSTSNDEVAGYFSADFDADIGTDDGPTVRIAGYDDTNNGQFGIQAFVPQRSNNAVAIEGVYLGGGNRDGVGIIGDASSANNGYGYGVIGYGDRYGVYGDETGNNTAANFGVYAQGDIGASGTKSFMIDHPLDPENKYLKHYSVESDQVLLQYRGIETFNSNGEALVSLPDYYGTININASYQLTAIGAAMPNLHIKRKVDNSNTFIIAGGISSKEVSWLIISERNDPYMQQYPDERKTVVDKKHHRGKYVMPDLYGQPDERSINNNFKPNNDNIQKTLTITEKESVKKDLIDNK